MIKKPLSRAQSPWSTWKIGKIDRDNQMVLFGQKRNALCPSYSPVPFQADTETHDEEGEKEKLRISEVVLVSFCFVLCGFFFFQKQLDSFPRLSFCNGLDIWEMPAIITSAIAVQT